MGDLYALDFDGVLCDSCGESYASAAKAAKLKWPHLFNDEVISTLKDWMVDQIRIVRPVLQSRYQNLILIRLLLEMKFPSLRKSSVAEWLTVEEITENWLEVKKRSLDEWGEDEIALKHEFGNARDEWKDHDIGTWVGANRLYPGVADALKFATSTIYVVTGKESRFVEIIVKELGGVTLPTGRILTVEPGSENKLKVLKQLQDEHQGLKLHLVEDRLATLKKAIKEPEVDAWNLYLAGWGYNTQKEKDEAATIPRLQILQLADFCKNLK